MLYKAGGLENMLTYLTEFGNVGLQERPFGEVDALVLCQFSYLQFGQNRVQGNTSFTIFQEQNTESLFQNPWYADFNRKIWSLFAEGTRFGRMPLLFYEEESDDEQTKQFAAITIQLSEHVYFLIFRGTDDQLIGWKEDLYLGLSRPTRGQLAAVSYTKKVMMELKKKDARAAFYLGGHSKGGNFAVYAAMQLPDEWQEYILQIYSMDGPGFRPEIRAAGGYEAIREKIVKIVPESSIIGLILETEPERSKVIKSHSRGLLQHNPANWIIERGEFVETEKIHLGSRLFQQTFNTWLYSLTEEQILFFVDTLFGVLEKTESKTLSGLQENWQTYVPVIGKECLAFGPEELSRLGNMLRQLLQVLREQHNSFDD
ncbi:MAG: DUF2974 domain-containing protein [Lachnospiraceae bacterium]|nr:DUF2974 domain-containing protein [Lachnospiraceae bacterium]